jgi:hypothetical protein
MHASPLIGVQEPPAPSHRFCYNYKYNIIAIVWSSSIVACFDRSGFSLAVPIIHGARGGGVVVYDFET